MIGDDVDGRGEIKLLHGYAVVEQEVDGDGRLLRWRQLTVTLPMGSGMSMSFNVDFVNYQRLKSLACPWRYGAGPHPRRRAD